MLVAVLAVLALLAVLVWYQSTGVSTRQRWRGDGRFGQLAPEPPWPRHPVDANARFALWPRRRILVPAVVGAVLLVGAALLAAAGLEPLAVVALVIGGLEAGASYTAARHNREAVAFAAERLLDGGPTGSGPPEASP